MITFLSVRSNDREAKYCNSSNSIDAAAHSLEGKAI